MVSELLGTCSMKPILLIYATREGHTRRIAERLSALVAARSTFELVDAAQPPGGLLVGEVWCHHREPPSTQANTKRRW